MSISTSNNGIPIHVLFQGFDNQFVNTKASKRDTSASKKVSLPPELLDEYSDGLDIGVNGIPACDGDFLLEGVIQQDTMTEIITNILSVSEDLSSVGDEGLCKNVLKNLKDYYDSHEKVPGVLLNYFMLLRLCIKAEWMFVEFVDKILLESSSGGLSPKRRRRVASMLAETVNEQMVLLDLDEDGWDYVEE